MIWLMNITVWRTEIKGMSALEINDTAPDFILQTIEDEPVSLQQSLQGKNSVLLVFLRHLG